jgi:hypothetical protein
VEADHVGPKDGRALRKVDRQVKQQDLAQVVPHLQIDTIPANTARQHKPLQGALVVITMSLQGPSELQADGMGADGDAHELQSGQKECSGRWLCAVAINGCKPARRHNTASMYCL